MDLEEFMLHYKVALAFKADQNETVQNSYERHMKRTELLMRGEGPWGGSRIFTKLQDVLLDKIISYDACLEYFFAHTSSGAVDNANSILEKMSDEDKVTLTLMGFYEDDA